MNTWYFLNENNDVCSEKISPVFVSLHINNLRDLTQNTVDYLKKHQPIGCRDHNTQEVLAQEGVATYFSGCLTTTMDIDYKIDDSQRTDDIVFCDYKPGDCAEADLYLQSLKNYDLSKIEFTTHNFTKNSTHEQRFEESRKLLKKYSKAKLVVTNRIHCALPCLAMGTPVILVNKNYDNKRFGGLYDFVNTIGSDKNGNFSINVNVDKNVNVINSKDYLRYADRLKSTVKTKLKT